MPLQITNLRTWICFMNWVRRTFRRLERCESIELINVLWHRWKRWRRWNAEHITTGRTWQLKSWSGTTTAWSRWHRTVLALSHWGQRRDGRELTRRILTPYSPSWLTSTVGTRKELTEWIRTLSHVAFQSGHVNGGGNFSHIFLMLSFKTHGWSIGSLQQLPFHF